MIWLLSSTVDPELKVFPDPRKWEPWALQLRERKVDGFYYGSPIGVVPIGAREIFEGQARFAQIQYLYVSSGCTASWSDFEEAGMFKDVYLLAFLYFLEVSGLKVPDKFDDPIIGLFLLVCDVAINPVEGLVLDLQDLSRLVKVHDPGHRFFNLCLAIKRDKAYFSNAICNYSADEYWEVSNRLCEAIGVASPLYLVETVGDWPVKQEEIAVLLDEDRTFKFSEANLPVRVFLARFIRLQMDKRLHPEFFCWSGIWMTELKKGPLSLHDAGVLFEEHRALFVDKDDGDVYPRTFGNREEKPVQNTFDLFYYWVAIYDLTRQWLVGPGKFDFDFGWLTSNFSADVTKDWAARGFENAYGVRPDSFRIVD